MSATYGPYYKLQMLITVTNLTMDETIRASILKTLEKAKVQPPTLTPLERQVQLAEMLKLPDPRDPVIIPHFHVSERKPVEMQAEVLSLFEIEPSEAMLDDDYGDPDWPTQEQTYPNDFR